MRESFTSGGITARSYKDFYGESGDYDSRFLVYNQKNDPDGNGVIKEKTPDGRTTYWVPEVQR
jgi:formamidopyrimidine-DNA glycosylase